MSVKQLEDQLLALPLIERRAFTHWLDEHRDEIEQPSALARSQESEVRQRLAEMDADPAMRVPFAEADLKQMFQEIMDERAAKTPPSSALTISEAINWYEDQRPGLGLEFAADLLSHYRHLARDAGLYAVRFSEVRRLNLDRLPYGLF